jgi:hypothetical protein
MCVCTCTRCSEVRASARDRCKVAQPFCEHNKGRSRVNRRVGLPYCHLHNKNTKLKNSQALWDERRHRWLECSHKGARSRMKGVGALRLSPSLAKYKRVVRKRTVKCVCSFGEFLCKQEVKFVSMSCSEWLHSQKRACEDESVR